MAEQLGLDQLVGNRGAVHLHERAVAPQALAMDRARHQLLADAALAPDQHGGVGRRRLLNRAAHRGQRRRVADDLVLLLGVAAIALVLGLEPPRVDGVADRDQHALALERLLDEIKRAEPRRFDRGGDVGVAGDDDDRRDLDEVPQLLQHFEAVHARHLDVEEHQVGRLALDQLDAFLAGRRQHHVVAVVLERHLQRVANRRLVVDDQDAWLHRDSVRTVRMAR